MNSEQEDNVLALIWRDWGKHRIYGVSRNLVEIPNGNVLNANLERYHKHHLVLCDGNQTMVDPPVMAYW